jgi:hypothetical protein
MHPKLGQPNNLKDSTLLDGLKPVVVGHNQQGRINRGEKQAFEV